MGITIGLLFRSRFRVIHILIRYLLIIVGAGIAALALFILVARGFPDLMPNRIQTWESRIENFRNGELFFYIIPIFLFILLIVVIFLPEEEEEEVEEKAEVEKKEQVKKKWADLVDLISVARSYIRVPNEAALKVRLSSWV